MPSRKLTAHCPQCGCKNHLRAHYCNQCGARLDEDRAAKDEDGRAKLYADIAHPINSACREMIQQRVVLEAFAEEQERAQQPGYVCRYDDYGEDNYATLFGDPGIGMDEESVRPRRGGGIFQSPLRAQSEPDFPRPPHANGQRLEKSYAEAVHGNERARVDASASARRARIPSCAGIL